MTSEAAGTGATAEEEAAFRVGDAVVHPHHGAGVVVGRRRRRVLGAPARSCVEIEIAHTSLRIIVPCENATRVGLRAVVGRRRLGRIVEVLEDQPEVVSESWAARQKRYRAMLKGGDVLALAAVIRDLAHRHAARVGPRASARFTSGRDASLHPSSALSSTSTSTTPCRSSTSMSGPGDSLSA
jgi:RNA polymerase-interacting CarD/CdnL/TRCF family regulator